MSGRLGLWLQHVLAWWSSRCPARALPQAVPFPHLAICCCQLDESCYCQHDESCYNQHDEGWVLTMLPAGDVEGMLWYFPYENERETLPTDSHTLGRKIAAAAGPTQNPAGGHLATQHPAAATAGPRGATQHGARPAATQRPAGTQAGRAGGWQEGDGAEEEDGGSGPAPTGAIFETFWQGRLIPGGAVDSLPFLDAVRAKRNAAGGAAAAAGCILVQPLASTCAACRVASFAMMLYHDE